MGSLRRLMLSLSLPLAGAGALPFLLPLRDGEPLLDWRTLPWPELPRLQLDALREKAAGLVSGDAGAPVTLYKWRDGRGAWHFSNTPPDGVPFETTSVDTAANVVPAVTAPATPSASAPATAFKGIGGLAETARTLRQKAGAPDAQEDTSGETGR